MWENTDKKISEFGQFSPSVRTVFVPQVISHDPCYSRKTSNMNIDMEYTHDIAKILTCQRDLPMKPNSRNLVVN